MSDRVTARGGRIETNRESARPRQAHGREIAALARSIPHMQSGRLYGRPLGASVNRPEAVGAQSSVAGGQSVFTRVRIC